MAEQPVPEGWMISSICRYSSLNPTPVCTGTSNPESVTLGDGERVTLIFQDKKQGKIMVDKVTNPPGDLKKFDFTGSWGGTGGTAFQLDDDDPVYDSGYLAPGDYIVCETPIPDGWALTGISVTGALSYQFGDGTTTGWHAAPFNPATDKCVKISLAPGEEPVVTFTDTKKGSISVDKVTSPTGDDQLFGFSASWGTATTFQLADSSTPYESGYLMPGEYSICESTLPAGWALTDISVSGATSYQYGDGTTTGWHDAPFDPITDTCIKVTIGAGQNAIVTFTDTKKGSISVDKVTNPTGDGQLFGFSASWGTATTFQLADGSTPYESGYLMPGEYFICESTLPAGWALTDISVTGASSYQYGDGTTTGWHDAPFNPVTDTCIKVTIAAGQNAIVTFTDTKKGSISVDKVTNPTGDGQLFGFSASWGTATTFQLADGTTPYPSGYLMPGEYSICESTLPEGWALTEISVSGATSYQYGDGTTTGWHDAPFDPDTDTCVKVTIGAGQNAIVTFDDKRCQTANAGEDTEVCEGYPVVVTGTAQYATSVLWTVKTGDGTLVTPFDSPPSPYKAQYTPPSTGESVNPAVLTFTAYGPCGISGAVSDDVEIFVVQHPVATITVIAP